MFDQLLNIVKQFGQRSVVNNPEVPNQYNHQVMADATGTIANGFQNVLAGGGLASILQLFRGRNNRSGGSRGSVLGSLASPLVAMMVGHFISKLVSKYKMAPAAASNVANDLIPNSVNKLVEDTRDPSNSKITLDSIINSLTGRHKAEPDSSRFQQLISKDEQADNDPEVDQLSGELKQKAQEQIASRPKGVEGWMDYLKGLFH
jgi:hypothetical protein